jgi:glycosyltransferase involved in cell wall biosynthesis
MGVRHSILMITYNQEDYLDDALTSVLNARVRPHEIVVCDDCSADGTRDLLRRYRDRYPDIFKLHFNARNLGIWGNMNNIADKASGDLISYLAGDDWYAPDFLENMSRTVDESGLDPQQDNFQIMSNTLFWRDGATQRRHAHPADAVSRHSPPGLLLRGMFENRHVGISAALHRLWPPYPPGSDEIGAWADLAHHLEFAKRMARLITVDYDGAVYRQGVGVVARQKKLALLESKAKAFDWIVAHAESENGSLVACDLSYARIMATIARHEVHPRLRGLGAISGAIRTHCACWPHDKPFLRRRFNILRENALKAALGMFWVRR